MIDFHCHLDLYPNPAEVVEDCRRRGIYVLSVTTTPAAWKGTSALAENAPRIRTALGFHPQIVQQRRSDLALFDQLLPHSRCIGEIGLDGAHEFRSSWDIQIEIFEHILIKCSAEGGRVMTIHSRRASGAVLDRIQKFSEAGTFVLHWFSGSLHDLDRAIRLGCWFSIGPAMLKSGKGRALVEQMPPERVLTESDGPFAQLDGVPVLPWQAEQVMDYLSNLWSLPRAAVDKMLLENLHKLLPDLHSPKTQ